MAAAMDVVAARNADALLLFFVPQASGQGSRMAPGLQPCCRGALLWAGTRQGTNRVNRRVNVSASSADGWVSSELGRALLLLLPDN
jgi:hypothetical protein